jgi:dienelactone hydrolase
MDAPSSTNGPDEPQLETWLPTGASGPVPAIVLAGDLWARPGRGLLATLGPELANRGHVVIAPTPGKRRDTKGFATGTLRDREDEIDGAVTALFERVAARGEVDIRRLAVVGHGLGGSAAMARAARDSRIRAVFAVAAPRTLAGMFPKAAVDAWGRGDKATLKAPADGTLHALGPAIANDWKARATELDHAEGARATGATVVWIHGTEDTVVPTDESRRAYWRHPEAGRRARLVEVIGAEHDFGVAADAEPAEALPSHARKLADAIAEQLALVFPKA